MCMYWLFYKTIEQPCAVVRIEVHREYLKQTGVFKCPFAHASKSMNSKSLGMPTVQIVQTFCKEKVQSHDHKMMKTLLLLVISGFSGAKTYADLQPVDETALNL